MSWIEIATTLQYLTTIALFGLIWTIQLVHYPAFRYVAEEQFNSFQKMHSFNITLFVAPLMIFELLAAGFLLVAPSISLSQAILFLIVLLIWMSTFFLSVPYHNTLSKGKDERVIEKLILTNWIRTILWTLKLILIMVLGALP